MGRLAAADGRERVRRHLRRGRRPAPNSQKRWQLGAVARDAGLRAGCFAPCRPNCCSDDSGNELVDRRSLYGSGRPKPPPADRVGNAAGHPRDSHANDWLRPRRRISAPRVRLVRASTGGARRWEFELPANTGRAFSSTGRPRWSSAATSRENALLMACSASRLGRGATVEPADFVGPVGSSGRPGRRHHDQLPCRSVGPVATRQCDPDRASVRVWARRAVPRPASAAGRRRPTGEPALNRPA